MNKPTLYALLMANEKSLKEILVFTQKELFITDKYQHPKYHSELLEQKSRIEKRLNNFK